MDLTDFLTASRQKVLLTGSLFFILCISTLAFSASVVDALDMGAPIIALITFIPTIILGPIVSAAISLSGLYNLSGVAQILLLSVAVLLNIVYLYVLSCIILWIYKKIRTKD
jgi:hypothetical protein